MIKILLVTNPLSDFTETLEVPFENKSIAQILRDLGKDGVLKMGRNAKVVAIIEDKRYPSEQFSEVIPTEGQTVRIVPAPGFFLIPFLLWAVGTLATAVGAGGIGATLVAAGAAVSTWAATTTLGGIIAAVVNALGSTLLGMLLAPKQKDLDGSSQGSAALVLSGGRNQLRPYERVPRIYGSWRYIFPLAARTYSEVKGDDQFLRMLMSAGYGPLVIEDIKIGEAPIAGFSEVEIEIVQVSGSNSPVSLYPSSIIEDNPSVILKDERVHSVNPDGSQGPALANANYPWATRRTTTTEAVRLDSQFLFANGLMRMNEHGKPRDRHVQLQTRYRSALSNDEDDCVIFGDEVVGGSSTNPKWRVYKTSALPAGQYDVGARLLSREPANHYTPRTGGNGADVSQHMGDASWNAIRGYESGFPVVHSGTTVIACYIKASEQLSGEVQEFNALCTSLLTTWSTAGGFSAVPIATRNPAWICLDILRGTWNKNPIPDDEIDLPQFEDFADWCALKEFTCDIVFDYDIGLQAAFNIVARVGRGSMSMNGHKYSISWDEPERADGTYSALFTSRNSWDFAIHKEYPEPVHGWHTRFPNRANNFKIDEVTLYNDGYSQSNATLFSTIDQILGITEYEKLVRHVRYETAAMRFRPEGFTLQTGLDFLGLRRFDIVRLNHDVALIGGGAGRVASITTDIDGNILSMVADEEFTLTSGTSYSVQFQTNSGIRSGLISVDNEAGPSAALTTDSLTFGTALLPNLIAPDDHFAFGPSTNVAEDMIVTEIEPYANMTARMALLRAAPEIEVAVTGTSVPQYIPKLTTPVGYGNLPPMPPVIVSAVGKVPFPFDANPLALQLEAIVIPGTSVSGTFATTASFRVQYRESGATETDAGNWSDVTERAANGLVRLNVQTEQPVDLRVWAVSPNYVASRYYTASSGIPMVGNAFSPRNLRYETSVESDVITDTPGFRFIWDPPEEEGVSGYIVRYSHDEGQPHVGSTYANDTDFDIRGTSGQYILEVASINTNMERSEFAELTVNFVPDVPISRESASGLELVAQGNDFEFGGQDIHFRTRVTSSTNTDEEVEDGDTMADSGLPHPSFDHFVWRIEDANTGENLQDYTSPGPEWTFPYSENVKHGTRRSLKVSVFLADRIGNLSIPDSITVFNEVPGALTNVRIEDGVRQFFVYFDLPNDDIDFAGVRVDFGDTEGFSPTGLILNRPGSTYIADGPQSPIAVPTSVITSLPCFIKIAAYDRFGRHPSFLEYGDAVAVGSQYLDVSDVEEGSLLDTIKTSGTPNYELQQTFTEITGMRLTMTGGSARSAFRIFSNMTARSALWTSGGTHDFGLRIQRGAGSNPTEAEFVTLTPEPLPSEIPSNGAVTGTSVTVSDAPGIGVWTYRVQGYYAHSTDTDATITVNQFEMELQRTEV